MKYIPLSPNADIQTAAQLNIFLKLAVDNGLDLVNSANLFASSKFSNSQIDYFISLLGDYDPNQKIILRNGALLTPTNETVNFLKSGGFINLLHGNELTSIDKNCNRLLGFLANYTENRYLGYGDYELKSHTYLSQNELESAISKMKKLGYVGGGKTSTTLEDEGREFWERGGFKPNNNDNNSNIQKLLFMNYKPSPERIALLDKILNAYLDSSNNRIDEKSFKTVNNLSRNDFESAENMTLEYMDEMGFLVSELLGYGGRAFVRWKDKSEATRFRDLGGFSKYFEKENKDSSLNHKNTIIINGNNSGLVGQSLELRDFEFRPPENPQTHPIKDTKESNRNIIKSLWLTISNNPLISTILGGLIILVVTIYLKNKGYG